MGVAVDASGTAYVADVENHLIRTINMSTGVVRTLAGGNGSTTPGSSNGQGTMATFNSPMSVAVDTSGTVYVADFSNSLIRAITISSGVVRTLAGGNGGTAPGSANGQGTNATFQFPQGVAVDASGTVYVADTSNNLIRAINVSTGVVRTLAGGGFGIATNGEGTVATFNFPRGVAADMSSTVYVADVDNHLIRTVNIATGLVQTLAGGNGSTTSGFLNGAGTNAMFNNPRGVAVDTSGTAYVADLNNNIIRAINISTGVVRTLAGKAGVNGFANGQGTFATFGRAYGVAVEFFGTAYVVDQGYNLIRIVSSAAGICGGGMYFNFASQTCVSCAKPDFCPFGTYAALPCPVGFFCPTAALALPQLCLSGGYCNGTGLASPLPCSLGLYNSLVGQSSPSA
jgi:hypothetical protein